MIKIFRENTICYDRAILKSIFTSKEKMGRHIFDGCVEELKNGGTIVFDAEIYNMPSDKNGVGEYLRELFESLSVYEVLEEAKSWDGAWSIVYITPTGSIYAFTDPLGIKQLYFNNHGEISSTIIPIVEDFEDVDLLYKSEVYKWGYNTDDLTPWNTVKRILPNYLYCFVGSKVLNKGFYPYYDWKGPVNLVTLHNTLLKATSGRVNYPTSSKITVLLSGGLDSSIVASLTKESGVTPVLVTIANSGEVEFAQLMADSLGLPLGKIEYQISDDDILDALLVNECPVDLGSMVPQHAMMKALWGLDIITGDGADELFGGYRRAKEYDSQHSDVFQELTFYHLPRIQKMADRYDVRIRSPFTSQEVVKRALMLEWQDRIDKQILRDTFLPNIPTKIILRDKKPLKNPALLENPSEYKQRIFKLFYEVLIPRLSEKYNSKKQ